MTQRDEDRQQGSASQQAVRYALMAGFLALLWHVFIVRGLRLDDLITRSGLIAVGVWAVVRYDLLQRFPGGYSINLFGSPQAAVDERRAHDQERAHADRSFSHSDGDRPADARGRKAQARQPHSLLPEARVYTVRVPQGTAWQPELATSLMLRLADAGVVFAITAEYAAVRWQILDLGEQSAHKGEQVRGAVLAVYPEAEVKAERLTEPPFQERFYRAMFSVAQHTMYPAPILYPFELKTHDPLTLLGNLIGELLPDERVTYLIAVGNVTRKMIDDTKKMLERSAGESFAGNMLLGLFKSSATVSKERFTPELHKLFLQKLDDPSSRLFAAYLLCEIDTPSYDRLMHLAVGVESTFMELSGSHQSLLPYGDFQRCVHQVSHPAHAQATSVYAALVARLPELTGKRRSTGYGRLKTNWLGAPRDYVPGECCVLNTRELASLWHLPHDGFTPPTIDRSGGRRVRLPIALRHNREGVCLGENTYAGQKTPVYLRHEDRATHMIVTGRTQMGKSTLIHNLVHQDIQAGHGVAVVDPHGTLVSQILRKSIPAEREADVIVWDLADLEYPPPLNLLAAPPEMPRQDAAAQIMRVFEKLEKGFGETRMAGSLGDALEVLVFEDGATLRDINRLFSDDRFRRRVLENVDNPAAFDFWDEFENLSEREQRDLVKPLNHRLRRLFKNRTLYPVICHPDPLDFAGLIADNQIILVSLQTALGASLSERELEFMGALMVSQFQLAVMAGAAKKPFYVYIDEAERFVTSAVDEVLSEAAKQNLSLTLANQYLGQLEGRTLEAVMGNVGAMIFFQIGERDARTVAPYMRKALTVEDMVSQDAHQAAVVMRYQGQQQPPFSIDTRPAPTLYPDEADDLAAQVEREARIRSLAKERLQFKSRDEVLAWLNKRYPSVIRRQPRSKRVQDADEFSDPVDES